jgi:hypothetical protein
MGKHSRYETFLPAFLCAFIDLSSALVLKMTLNMNVVALFTATPLSYTFFLLTPLTPPPQSRSNMALTAFMAR